MARVLTTAGAKVYVGNEQTGEATVDRLYDMGVAVYDDVPESVDSPAFSGSLTVNLGLNRHQRRVEARRQRRSR